LRGELVTISPDAAPTPEYAVTDPRDGRTVQAFPSATEEELEAAVDAAHRAITSWGRATVAEDRCEVLRRVAEEHVRRRDDLAAAISQEMGKPRDEALGEVDFAADIYRYYAAEGPGFLADEEVPVTSGEGSATVRRSPFGVLLGIMPWNFPAYQVARFAAPNLAIGNTILLKHAPQCPLSASLIQEIMDTAGVVEGAYVNVRLSNEQVAELIADPRVQGISLTGSERAGAAVAEIAGRHLKKVVLELGGSDPFVLLDSDDLGAVVNDAVAARMENTGQACNAAKRFIVVDHLYDKFVSLFTAAMEERSTNCPPLSSERAAEMLGSQVRAAVAQGAAFSGGERRGAYFPPGVLTGVSPDDDVFHQELFGPVAMVFRVSGEDEAVELANNTPFGLGSYVYTNDPEQATRVADQIQAGMVFVNCVGAEGAELPFGGVKRSGFGRELGRYGIDEFVNKKLIRTP
jgi:succinate-semialdehyde dehydrogenase/glutarate-semialdehyde dehydrogenase